MTNVVGESISSVICGIFIVKQLGKHDFSGDFLPPNKYEKQEMFFWSAEQIALIQFFARRNWSCSIMENLRCLNFAVNK